jgi:hypothetical protein
MVGPVRRRFQHKCPSERGHVFAKFFCRSQNNWLLRSNAPLLIQRHNGSLPSDTLVPSSRVRSNPVLLGRVVLNLVSNAVRYTKSGGIVVGCRYREDHVRIELWDSGPGIPSDARYSANSTGRPMRPRPIRLAWGQGQAGGCDRQRRPGARRHGPAVAQLGRRPRPPCRS